MTDKIDGLGRQKLVEMVDDDPAKVQEDRAKADYASRFQTTSRSSCEADPERFPCAPKDKIAGGPSYAQLAKTMPTDTAVVSPKTDSPAKPTSTVLPTTTNATRIAELKDGTMLHEAHRDGIGGYATFTAIKKSGPNGYIVAGNASAQGGAGVEVQAAALRASGVIGDGKTASGELLTAHVAAGLGKNDDGSTGYHSGAGVTVASVEGTQTSADGSSVTGGLSVGVGADVSVGTKTAPNGDTLACGRIAVGPLILGACHRF